MNYIFFSTGPLHLINIFEMIKKERINKYKIYIFQSSNKYVNLEFKNTINFLKLKNIINFSFSYFKIIRFFQYICLLIKFKIKNSDTEVAFVISDFRNTFFHLLRIFFSKSKFLLLDEGYDTLISYKKYISRGIYFPIKNYNNLILSFFQFLSPKKFKILIYSEIKIYSYFYKYINKKNIKKNLLSNLKKKFINIKKKDNSTVFFIGTKLYERGEITLDEELKILDKIKLYWERRGKTLIYIAKRTSSNKKLDLIKKKLSMKCIRFNLPLEIAVGTVYKKIPYAVCSFSSTANFTLKKIYNIKSYYFFPKKYKKKVFFDGVDKYLIYSVKEIISL